jgi:hypothetical protein
VHEKNSLSSSNKNRVVEYSMKKGSTRCASSKRMPGGREAFIFKKYFGPEIDEISAAQGVCEGGLILSPEAQEEQCLVHRGIEGRSRRSRNPIEVSKLTSSGETKDYELSIQLDHGHWFKKDLDC